MPAQADLITIRGVDIRLKRRFGGRRATFVAYLDEKPLGRSMRPEWQRCITVTGEVDLLDMKTLSRVIPDEHRDRIRFAPEAGVVIRDTTEALFTKRFSTLSIGLMTQVLADTIDRAERASR